MRPVVFSVSAAVPAPQLYRRNKTVLTQKNKDADYTSKIGLYWVMEEGGGTTQAKSVFTG